MFSIGTAVMVVVITTMALSFAEISKEESLQARRRQIGRCVVFLLGVATIGILIPSGYSWATATFDTPSTPHVNAVDIVQAYGWENDTYVVSTDTKGNIHLVLGEFDGVNLTAELFVDGVPYPLTVPESRVISNRELKEGTAQLQIYAKDYGRKTARWEGFDCKIGLWWLVCPRYTYAYDHTQQELGTLVSESLSQLQLPKSTRDQIMRA